MSADNAVAILITRDTYRSTAEGYTRNLGRSGRDLWRVAHICGPDGFDFHRAEEPHNLGWWLSCAFGEAAAFDDAAAAQAAAEKLAGEIVYVEHGVLILDARPLNFPGH